jgi:hypothetical protein
MRRPRPEGDEPSGGANLAQEYCMIMMFFNPPFGTNSEFF